MPRKRYRGRANDDALHFIDRIDLTVGGFGPSREPRGERLARLHELWMVHGKRLMAEFPLECWGFTKFGKP